LIAVLPHSYHDASWEEGEDMKVIDLAPEHELIYFQCLEDWSEEMKEAGDHKANWYNRMKDRGLRVKLAEDDQGVIGGMIQYLPAEEELLEGGDGFYFIKCIWVHGHKQGRGDYRGRGMGTALLEAAEQDARNLGARGMLAWGIVLPFFIKASWYKKHGYRKVDRDGIAALLWKPFVTDAGPPKFIPQKKKPERIPGQVTVSVFINGWCPAQNAVFERTKRAASEFGEKVVFRPYFTSDRSVLEEWGISDGLFIDAKQINTGPPPGYDKIRRLIEKRVKKL
jgi:GNAT superfamily N-acetyltransferase